MTFRDSNLEALRTHARVTQGFSGSEKLALVSELTALVHSFAVAGLRERMPGATEDDLLAAHYRLVFGVALADNVMTYRRQVRDGAGGA